MSRTIHLGVKLDLGAHAFATNVVAALGMRGSGKSNVMTVAVEGLLGANVQVIVLDYVGIWFGLRLLPDGKRPSPFEIPVLGGRHGDIPLVSAAGRQVAEALAASHSSAVLDISAFTKSERIKFAADFGEAFFHAKKSHEGPVFLVLEEAQRFVPQVMRFSDPALSRCLGAFEEIAEVGRNYGIGLGLISQRPQKINKDVLNLAELVFAFQTNGVLERKAISEWVQEKGAEGRTQVTGELPSLPRGTALVWSPSTFRLYGKYAFDKKTTYDAGATPDQVRAAVKVKQLDLKSLEGAMEAVVKEAKTNDPRALKARIGELERQVARGEWHAKANAEKHEVQPRVVEKSVLKAADLARLEKLVERLGVVETTFSQVQAQGIERMVSAQTPLIEMLKTLRAALKPDVRDALKTGAVSIMQPGGPTRPAFVDLGRGPRQARVVEPLNDGVALPEKSQRMLGALKQGEAMGLTSMPFRNVAVIAGVAPTSGTTSNRKGALVKAGLIAVSGDRVALTDAGRAHPIDVMLPPTDPAALLAYWKREIGTAKIGQILEIVVMNGPISNDELMHLSGMANSGTFSNYKGALIGRGLIEKRGDTYVATEPFNR